MNRLMLILVIMMLTAALGWYLLVTIVPVQAQVSDGYPMPTTPTPFSDPYPGPPTMTATTVSPTPTPPDILYRGGVTPSAVELIRFGASD